MRPPYVTGEKPDINSTLESAKTLDRHLQDAIRDLGPAKGMPMSTTPAPGSFAASLKAMMDEAKSGLDQAQAAGRQRVKAAVDKIGDAAVATGKVSESMAQQIEEAADSAMSDLGQISNLPPE